MALFPAYLPISRNDTDKIADDSSKNNLPTSTSSWLSNPSFKVDDDVVILSEKLQDSTEIDVSKTSDDEETIIVVEKSKKHKKQKKRKRSKSKEKISKKSKQFAEKDPVVSSKVRSIFIQPGASSTSEIFVYDLKRDIENLQFGSVDKKQKALFKCKINVCLGASQRENDLLFEERQKLNTKLPTRYFGKSSKKLFAEPKQFLPSKVAVSQSKFSEDFLPIENESVIDGEKCIFDPKVQMYRPVTQNFPVGQYTVGENDVQTLVTENSELITENKRFNQRLAANSNDLNLWLEFLKFQDRFYEDKAHKGNEKLTKLALLERKLAIVEKAIEQNVNSIELKLLRMDLGLEAGWDREKLKSEWKKLEFNHVNQTKMWFGRLQFAYSYFSQFAVSKQAALFDVCLEKLTTVMNKQLITHPCLPFTEEYFVDFLVGKLNLWKISGNLEKAFAYAQALIEFNYRQPEIVVGEVPLEQKRRVFEMFWDSNLPRIGDFNSVGWSLAMQKKQPLLTEVDQKISAETDKLEDKILSGVSKGEAEIWLNLENVRECHFWHPFVNSGEPEDSERVVLFDDIANGIYEIKPESRFKFVLKILKQLGVMMPNFSSSNETVWYDDDSLRKCLFVFDSLPKLETTSLENIDDFRFALLEQLESDVTNVERVYLAYSEIYHKVSVLISNDDMPLNEKCKVFKKFAKQILSKEHNAKDYVLYGAFAEGLSRLNKHSEAANILQTVIISMPKFKILEVANLLDQLVYLHLLNLLIKALLLQNNGEDMLRIQQLLSSFISFGSIDNVDENFNVLKIKKLFSELFSQIIDQPFVFNVDPFVFGWLGCTVSLLSNLYATYVYVSSKSVNSFGPIFQSCRAYLEKILAGYDKLSEHYMVLDKLIEDSLEFELFLLQFNAKNFVASPKILIAAVENALLRYPCNANWLKLLCHFHVNGQMINKLRRFFSNSHTAANPVQFLASIYLEFSRYLKLKEAGDYCDLYKIRHVLEKSVDVCKNSVTLWRLYIKMESLWCKSGDMGNVKKIVYQAIRQCPWSKELYLSAIRIFPDDFRSFIDLMVEKEIRVYLPLEELSLLLKNRAQSTGNISVHSIE